MGKLAWAIQLPAHLLTPLACSLMPPACLLHSLAPAAWQLFLQIYHIKVQVSVVLSSKRKLTLEDLPWKFSPTCIKHYRDSSFLSLLKQRKDCKEFGEFKTQHMQMLGSTDCRNKSHFGLLVPFHRNFPSRLMSFRCFLILDAQRSYLYLHGNEALPKGVESRQWA